MWLIDVGTFLEGNFGRDFTEYFFGGLVKNAPIEKYPSSIECANSAFTLSGSCFL